MFRSLKSLLGKTLQQHKIAPHIRATLICNETAHLVTEIIGEKLSKETHVLYIKNNFIAISASSSPVISELKLHESRILDKLAKKFPDARLLKLKFFIDQSPHLHA